MSTGTVEPVIDPPEAAVAWLVQAVELEGLAQTAQEAAWTTEQSARAAALVSEISALMASAEPPPVTVPPEPTTPPPPMVDDTGKLKRVKYPPGAARTLKATAANFMDVINNKAQPGDHVVCEGGSYDQVYTLTKSFPGDKPLVIRSATPLETSFAKGLNFNAPGYWLHECRVPGVVRLNSGGVNLTRCWLQNADGVHGANKAIGNVQIGWCRFTGQNKTSGSTDHIFFWLPGAGNYPKPTSGPNNISIHRNFFDDPASKASEDHVIYFGHTKADPNDLPMMADVYIDMNLIAATCQRTRIVYLKRGAVVRRNSDLSTNRNFGVRHGMASKFWANITKSSNFHFGGAMVVGGTPEHYHDIRGNEAPNAKLVLWCGSAGTNFYQAASYAMAASNKFRSIEVGVKDRDTISAAQGGLTKGCKIFLDGKVPRSAVSLQYCVKDTITIRDDAGGVVIPKTFPLTEEMVGLETKGQGS
jgi:hypothetical protein